MLSKYATFFKTSLENQLNYRFNFLLGRIRGILVLILLYTLFQVLTSSSSFAGYTTSEFVSYLFLMHILRNFVFGNQSREISREINEGTFSQYLVKPVTYFVAVYMREIAERLILMLCSFIEIGFFWLIMKPQIFFQTNIEILFLFFLSVILAHILYVLSVFLVSILAFWSREAYGPRFLFEWLLEFASGVYFPLGILTPFIFGILQALPFMYMLYVPIQIYLGKTSGVQIVHSLFVQSAWIVALAVALLLLYKKGLKKYSGEGI